MLGKALTGKGVLEHPGTGLVKTGLGGQTCNIPVKNIPSTTKRKLRLGGPHGKNRGGLSSPFTWSTLRVHKGRVGKGRMKGIFARSHSWGRKANKKSRESCSQGKAEKKRLGWGLSGNGNNCQRGCVQRGDAGEHGGFAKVKVWSSQKYRSNLRITSNTHRPKKKRYAPRKNKRGLDRKVCGEAVPS